MNLPHRRGYATAEQAMHSKAFTTNPGATLDTNCLCGMVHVVKPKVVEPEGVEPKRLVFPAVRRAPGEFTPRVKLLIRTRAGLGDPFDARCESCGCFLGISGGQFQHRAARGAGGCRDEVVNGTAGGALMCGTRYTGCHSEAENRSDEMKRWGFWIKHGTTPAYDPRNVRIWWHRTTWLWLPETGTEYLTQAPGQVAA